MDGFVRHIRLKSSHRQSASAAVNAHIGLERKPSACIIWISFDRNTMELGQFLWFGAKPGRPALAFGGRLAKHVRANHTGFKGFRPNLRVISKSRFRELSTIDQVARELFGITT